MKKRIISLFMCLVMAFSLLSTAAWAEPYFCPGIGGCTATWVFTPEEDGKYAVVTGTVDITVVKRAEPVYTVGGLDKETGEKSPGGDGDSVSISMGITEPEHKQDDKVQNVIRGSEELPVAKDTTTPIRNRMAGISAAGMESCTTPVRNWPMFMDLVRLLMLHAHTRIIMTCIMLAAPLVHLSMAPPRVMSLDLMPAMPAAMEPVRKHMAIAIWILAWPKQPMKPLTQIWPV